MTLFTGVNIYQHFQQVTYLLLVFISCSFPLLFGFLPVSMSFLSEHVCLNIYYEIFTGRRLVHFFLPLFLAVHINFQYELKYHASLFIVAFLYLFSSFALLIFFLICSLLGFFAFNS